MSDSQDQDRKAPLKLTQPGKLELKKTVETGQVRQSFSHGRSKVVTVEVRKKRTFTSAGGAMHEIKEGAHSAAEADLAAAVAKVEAATRAASAHDLTNNEKAARAKALQDALHHQEEVRARAEEEAVRRAIEDEAIRAAEEEAQRLAEEEASQRAAEPQPEPEEEAPAPPAPAVAAPVAAAPAQPKPVAAPAAPVADATAAAPRARTEEEEEEEERAKKRAAAHKPAPVKRTEPRRRTGKLTITDALTDDDRSERGRSLAAVKRARERERLKHMQKGSEKVIREVIVPESITVQELANRMAVRGADVIKCLMRLGVMATINQNIDADTAELVVTEFGHNMKRVSEADVLVGLEGEVDTDEVLFSRPPVVTVMGHVDHGKTSLLDALRATDVVSGEAGGITQHIGAYQVTMSSGDKITFIDTPGHEAFTAMRARGAKVTDIVVLVVAADDGIMPQTVEAIRHAKAAGVPIIVAINKIDKPGANTEKVRQELLQHELVTEELGGDVLAIEVSAKKRLNLEKLEEAILLQAEILDLKANPDRAAQGVVVEAKMEKGRGSVATVLVQKGTIKVGDVFVAGAEWGRVRALVDDHGNSIKEAGPSTPVEVLGLQGTPAAGDDFVTVDDEGRAREIAGYRSRMDREAKAKLVQRGTLEQMFSAIKSGEAQELPVVIKGDVQGSIEAISSTLEKMGNENVRVRILHAAVGAINESDITLAKASNGLLIGFNVRANPQARDMARRDGVDIRYYSIIYDVTDDLKKMLSGMLAPELRERFLGYASIREVFNITKVGKVAGCMITEGTVKRGAKVRLLRDNVVIHTGDLGQLKRFKDDVKDVREGYECGMSFTNYEDIRVGDVIECFEIEEIAVTL
ncbi:Translation initiation factor 2 [Paramagnetospirillum magnetotacticum MS-1]|uniref:Translation initiation factor IF-2 n=1 Tax=Paramagnetospirillum magnetotacticum MS-1 TaxID=272627 RepID=A0A0C2YSC6_PARME|nr:translation initiation factor IF-2 [Paramagnetospirillum magnetotacticum]KIL97590.1 Translation initiation factor 2 [Paramagnetospirillum magnetotacticum MS-1]